MQNKINKNIYPNKGVENIIDWISFASNINNYLDKSHIIKDEEHVKAGICIIDGKKIFIKKYINRNIFFKLKRLFGVTKAKKNCMISNCIVNSLVNYPKAYGYITSGNIFCDGDVFLILEAIDNIANDNFYKDFIYANKDNLLKYIEEVVTQIRYLHEKNVIHNDCKRSNFYLSGLKNNYKVGILDFDGAVKNKNISLRKRARDIGRFTAAIIEDFYRPGFKKLYSKEDLVNYIIAIYNKNSDNKSLKVPVYKKLNYHLKRKGLFNH
jgi:tRNA A-37 threonylcarbamoyl transferase component Bud32